MEASLIRYLNMNACSTTIKPARRPESKHRLPQLWKFKTKAYMSAHKRRIFCLLLLWPLMLFAADGNTASTWDQLSTEEREILKPFQERWINLAPERQEKLREGAKRWQSMTPEQREQARKRYERWQSMTPEQREQARKRYERYRQLPAEEKERLRRRHEWFKSLSPERRAELREKWKNMTPEERQRIREKRWKSHDVYGERGPRPRAGESGRSGR